MRRTRTRAAARRVTAVSGSALPRVSAPAALALVTLLAGRGAAHAGPGKLGAASARMAAAAARPAPGVVAPDSFPLSRVEPGMVGHGLTVFRGTQPERFQVRVVSVLRNFLPRQDIILIKVEDERVQASGVAAGMSGSPIYFEGKLAGALAYAWSFAKEPLAGVTPIDAMLDDARRPERPGAGSASGPAAALHRGSPAHHGVALAEAAGALPLAPGELRPIAVPLAVAGLPPATMSELRAMLGEVGLVPLAAAAGVSASGSAARPPELVPGGAVGVELIRGDLTAVATGTVTYSDGSTVLAFGHPMMGVGQVALPMVAAEIHTVMPSLASAFKIASPLGEVGAMVQDRRAAIVGKLGLRAERIPVRVRVVAEGGAAGAPFQVELARHERLTPLLVSIATSAALTIAEPDPVDVVVELSSRIAVRGRPVLSLREHVFSQVGFSARELAGSHALRALGTLLGNPFEPVTLEALDFEARLRFARDVVEIVGARVESSPVRAGGRARVRVRLRSFAGPELTEVVEIDVPRRLAGKTATLEIASGARVTPVRPEPTSLGELLDGLSGYYSAGSLVVSLALPETEVALRGALLPGLPPGALDTVQPGRESGRVQVLKPFTRVVKDWAAEGNPRIVTGKVELKLAVEDDALGRQAAR